MTQAAPGVGVVKRRRHRGIAAALALAIAGGAALVPAQAHHSFSMFDRREASKKKLVGTVKQFAMINPHASLKINVADGKGKVAVWAFEMTGVNGLKKLGWEPASLKPGDKITVTFFPLRFGSFGGQLLDVHLPNGRVLSALAEADRGYPKR